MGDKVEATYHGKEEPIYIPGESYLDAKDRALARQHYDLSFAWVWLEAKGNHEQQQRMLRAEKFLRALVTTCAISVWFFLCLYLFGYWGYLLAIPTTAIWFATRGE